jgi:PAS domain S-box-containing protein
MSLPDARNIISEPPEPAMLVESEGAVIGARSGASRQYLGQYARNSEGNPDSPNTRSSNEQPVTCKTMGALVHQQNDERWRAAFENSAIGITMADFEGRFFAANSAFLNMLGYTESELYQLTFVDVTYEEDRKPNQDLVRELVEGNRRHFQIEKRYYRKDGTLVWVRTNVALVPGMGDVAPFWFGIVEDITQRKRVEEELRLQIEVLQNMPAVAWTVTPDGRCDFINQFFLNATGMSREYIESQPAGWNKSGDDLPPLFSGLPPEDRERVASQYWNGIRTGEGWAFEAQHFHASDGNYHWYFDRAVPVRDSQGKIVRFVGTCTDIEPLKRAQENLLESETRLQAFFENSPSLIFLKDREGRYLYVNNEFKRTLRITGEQVKGKRDDDLFSPEQAVAFQSNDRKVLEAAVPMEFEEVALEEDGQHTSIVHKFPLFNGEGEIYAIGGIATDIEERKRAERELLTLRDELTAELTAMTRLHEFSTHVLATREFRPLLEEVLDATIALQHADFGNIQLYNPETQALEIVAQRGLHFRKVHDDYAACGRAMELRERVIVEDVETDSEFAPHRHTAASAGFRAVQFTPLVSRSGEFLGMLSTHFKRPHRPSPRDLRFTDLYAGHAAEIIERERLEAARRQVEDQYRNVVEAANDSVVTVDDTSDIAFVNPATTRMFGYSSAELVGQPVTMLMPEYRSELHISGFNRHWKKGERRINRRGTELFGLRKNGEEFPVGISSGEVVKNGKRILMIFISDITDRKQAEELRNTQIRQAAVRAEVSVAFGKEENLKAILRECAETIVLHFDAAFAGIWTLNQSGDMLELQGSVGMYTHLNGVHRRIPMGTLKVGMIARERKPLLTNDVLNDPRISDTTWEKTEGMVGFAGYPLIVGDRTVGVLAMFSRKSISTGTLEALASAADLIAQGIERHLAEHKLRASERSLRELTETIPQMLWSANADGGVDYCNRRVLDYTGLSAEQVRGAGWSMAVHKDDIEKMVRAWMAAVSTGEPFQYEFRCLRAADHAYRGCISSALPLRDQKGRVIKWFGSVVDLHDWKEAQQALQIAQAELARVSRLTTMGELTASIAHEVNQPLTAITNNSSACLRLLADRSLGSDILRGALERIVTDSNRASAVIARIRAFIKKTPTAKNELNLNELIQEVLALMERELSQNRVLLECELTEALPQVLGDRVQLQQVLLNLIMNGIEAMAPVTNRPRLLWMQSQIAESGNALVAIRDSGTGLGSDEDRVFTPFYTTKANGMGMGLSISRSLIEAHGGRLWATPNSPYGTVLYFTLPVAPGSPS